MSTPEEARTVRPGEELDLPALTDYLRDAVEGLYTIDAVQQFPGGYSNLTYLLTTNLGEWVLRRPPFGARIQTAHDMGREYRVLRLLELHYERVPRPIHYCEDESVVGAPFYVMERVTGLILRQRPPQQPVLTPEGMAALSRATVDNLADLHRLDLERTGLAELGKPAGYVARQVEGWIKRYYRAQTDDIPTMNALAQWMRDHQPADGPAALIHNDYKYDNLVLDPADLSQIRAVLDWEMATVGDARMDLGTTLAYWTEGPEAKVQQLAAGNLTWLPGNLNRQEVVDHYCAAVGRDTGPMLFYFVYGTFKIGVIVQQIYQRWKQGHTQDPRFGGLIEAVRYFGHLGSQAVERDRISDLLT